MDRNNSESLNILLTTFQGLGLPSTLVLQTPKDTPISTVSQTIRQQLPESIRGQILITSLANRSIDATSHAPIHTLLSTPRDTLVTLRLSARSCGGKGGFGSQLRAQGGRMSKRRRNGQSAAEREGSSRNLDGRRLRTVAEAKALAEYLAVRPEMDAKAKEQRIKRWEMVVEMAERRTEEIKNGNKVRLDGKWMDAKEEAGEKVKEAILASLKPEDVKELLGESEGSEENSAEDDSEESDVEVEKQPKQNGQPESSKARDRTFFGWEEEELSSDEEDEHEDETSKEKK